MNHSAKLDDTALGYVLSQLAMMSRSGLSLGSAFEILSHNSGMTAQSDSYSEITRKISDGAYPDDAMRESGLFPRQCCGLVAAGTESGKLDDTLDSLSKYYVRMGRLKKHLKSAMIQPLIMLGMSVAVFLLVILKILPVFDSVYASMGGSLNGVSEFLLNLGIALRHEAPVIAGVFIMLFIICIIIMLVEPFRVKISRCFMNKFGDRGVFRAINDARYIQAMSMGMDAGMATESASRMAASLQDDKTPARARYDGCSEKLSSGGHLSDVGLAAGILGHLEAAMLETGLRSGCEPEAARNVSAIMLDKAEDKIEKLSSLIEPIVTALGSGMIGLVILASMLPLLGVMHAIG